MKISKGKKVLPHLILIHGLDGVGKTTLASEFPNPLFIGPELGSMNVDASRVDEVDSWPKLMTTLREIYKLNDAKRYKTLVFDSLDWIEILITKQLCQAQNQPSIELCSGGYGKGYTDLKNEFIKFRDSLHALRLLGHNIVLICHSNVVEFNDPAVDQPYHRYELKLFKAKSGNVDIRALWREFVDVVLFLHHQTVTTGEKKDRSVRGQSTKKVLMHCYPDARWDAKNRFGLDKPVQYKLSKGYEALRLALKGD